MNRSRALSAIEAVTRVMVGYAVAMAAQLLFFPAIGISIALAHNVRLGALFTRRGAARGTAR